ncbi:hypothetical protein Ahy_A05g023793 isoform D [Arachis hypogaea]|uniref:Uncharacterized protein n=1 Tax=Arachis hypogaea TaxID=3818 RepID=A0A445D4F9_ARAHY|nr:hypothetical protein Ahy_A05g023793 isoform D [Arachis hypogaea]
MRKIYYLAPFEPLNSIFTDAPISMEDIDLELDEMELVAAAAGYYYYSCLTKQPSRCLSPRRCEFVSEVLNGHDDYCREMLRMDKHFLSSMQEQFAYSLRDSIAAAMWDDFLNKWDEWHATKVVSEYGIPNNGT